MVRERFFTSRLRVASYEELNAWLLDRCVAYIGAVCNLAARLCAEAKTARSWSAAALLKRSKRSPHSKISETSI